MCPIRIGIKTVASLKFWSCCLWPFDHIDTIHLDAKYNLYFLFIVVFQVSFNSWPSLVYYKKKPKKKHISILTMQTLELSTTTTQFPPLILAQVLRGFQRFWYFAIIGRWKWEYLCSVSLMPLKVNTLRLSDSLDNSLAKSEGGGAHCGH